MDAVHHGHDAVDPYGIHAALVGLHQGLIPHREEILFRTGGTDRLDHIHTVEDGRIQRVG